MRSGVFLAPYHADDQNPTLQIRRDLDLAEHLDRLGYDELWVGEHHSASFETIASPEIFIAAAAERTRRIRLGTGVVSLPYHNPLMVADRITQLEHQTQGRLMFGVGPGQLPSDAHMLGIDVGRQREMMNESLEVLIPLLRGEAVTHKTDWFDLRDARVQLAGYSHPIIEMAVASAVSPSGPRAAGKHGIGMLSFAATSSTGFDLLPAHWDVCEQLADEYGQHVDRRNWRLAVPMHLAETREQAYADVRHGILKLVRYFEKLGSEEMRSVRTVEAAIEHWTEHGLSLLGRAVIGTPDDAIERIEALQKQSGGFGTIMLLAHDCADPSATLHSYDLFANYVMSGLRNSNRHRHESLDWFQENSGTIVGDLRRAIGKTVEAHEEERRARGSGVSWGDARDLLTGENES
ncbi:MAG: LLM class flavin-dependent oxidoreductase [Deltaproteobacteria bacterium]|nr:LLM class flavin-dependent oxidoreductase [Deltaproteobacteria bacterium]MBW2361531.1 LLM class flavin-dependent oxidoreductase [Deltaproteobacteria bacterium]